MQDNFSDEEISNAFKTMDKDKSGKVSAAELKEYMHNLGGSTSQSLVGIYLQRPHNL